MKEKTGIPFRVAKEQQIIPGCTVSQMVYNGRNKIVHFALAAHTDISVEYHPYAKLLMVAQGEMDVYDQSDWQRHLEEDTCLLIPAKRVAGMKSQTSCVYTEIQLMEETQMNHLIKAGEVFQLAALVPYQEQKIVNMDVVHNDGMKFVVMAFDANTGLSPHNASGEALVFALDGEAIVTYEGVDHIIKKGDTFHFAKGGMHAITAKQPFKMALLLVKA